MGVFKLTKLAPFFTFSTLHQDLSNFNPKIVLKLSEIMVGSRIQPFRIPDQGVKRAPDPGSPTLYLTHLKEILMGIFLSPDPSK